jgi:hypothetical protein
MRQSLRAWCVEQVSQPLRDGSWQHDGPRGHEGRRDDRPWPQGAVVDPGNAIIPKRHDQCVHSGIPSWWRVAQSAAMIHEEYL